MPLLNALGVVLSCREEGRERFKRGAKPLSYKNSSSPLHNIKNNSPKLISLELFPQN